jgi:hypothetical protein
MSQTQLHAAANAPLSFNTLLPFLPLEIVYCILEHWMSPQQLTVVDRPTAGSCQDDTPSQFLVAYACDTDTVVASLPPTLRTEYWRLRHLSWLRSPKQFAHIYDFYMSHYLLSLMSSLGINFVSLSLAPSNLCQAYPDATGAAVHSLISQDHPRNTTRGLEQIILDFDAIQYFALFDVRVPPYNRNNVYHDPHLHRAATLLENCTDLTLVFGTAYRYAHPWYVLDDPACDDARCRLHVCEMGVIIDWILEYAWAYGFLQHIAEIRLEGDVQGWVRQKWEEIFTRQQKWNRECELVKPMWIGGDRFQIHKPDLHRIEWWGMDEEGNEEWKAKDNYPPICECERGCWELEGEHERW